MNNKPKPDNRTDNVPQIQKNIDYTIHNIELGNELIAKTENPKTKSEIKSKNERRNQALNSMRKEIKDEAADREKLEDLSLLSDNPPSSAQNIYEGDY